MAQAPANRVRVSLPFELVQEILCRTPVESLIRFKETCKQWNALISSDIKFKQKHLDHHIHTPERFLRIADDHLVQIMDPVTGILTERPVPNEFLDPISISWMVHCDGLMLCICEDSVRGGGYVSLAVWNPFLRRVKWIEPSVHHWVDDYFGIGYDDDASRDNYKILRFGYNLSSSPPGDTIRVFEIYEFMSDSWRGINAAGFNANIGMEVECVSVKGKMYWVANEGADGRYFILCFDFSEEIFKDVCECPDFWMDFSRLECFNGDRLSFLTQGGQGSRDIEVWMTNKLSDEVVSFANYFNVTTGPDLIPQLRFDTRPGYSIGKYRNIMAWCEATVEEEDDNLVSVFTFYDIDETGVVREIETGRREQHDDGGLSLCSYVYVRSLIPVPE
ncbi:PREDICTED: F-box protein At3g08750-like [Camelina sativa]|uniref:F-box protein At3g08750-like n=1 Tax=Camelina sativa TaxID=90675 RepID=A0ABM0WM57_CAMSA|nr:PREDICTED: F-box protein At3g08750-like [Camelina sativa]